MTAAMHELMPACDHPESRSPGDDGHCWEESCPNYVERCEHHATPRGLRRVIAPRDFCMACARGRHEGCLSGPGAECRCRAGGHAGMSQAEVIAERRAELEAGRRAAAHS